MRIIDAHVHVGDNQATKAYPLQELQDDLRDAQATGAVVFAFPEDMYRTVDNDEARRQANEYCLRMARDNASLYPFFFIWDGYALPQDQQELDDLSAFAGIKWHRHPDEPRYDYATAACERALEAIRELNMPVTLEEEFENTVAFIERSPDLPVIIPHTGMLNGGTERMTAFLDRPNVYFDTSVAPLEAVQFILNGVGVERLIFGTDVSGTSQPFYNFPTVELEKLRGLGLGDAEWQLLLAGNIDRLIAETNTAWSEIAARGTRSTPSCT